MYNKTVTANRPADKSGTLPRTIEKERENAVTAGAVQTRVAEMFRRMKTMEEREKRKT
jgi:hypothetical protein